MTSDDWAAPPPHVPDPPSTPTVCTTPPSAGDIPPSSAGPLLPLPEFDAPELEPPLPELDPLLEPDDVVELAELPELSPLELAELPVPNPLELDAAPEPDPLPAPGVAAPSDEKPSVVERLPHAPAHTARLARDAVRVTPGRARRGILFMVSR